MLEAVTVSRRPEWPSHCPRLGPGDGPRGWFPSSAKLGVHISAYFAYNLLTYFAYFQHIFSIFFAYFLLSSLFVESMRFFLHITAYFSIFLIAYFCINVGLHVSSYNAYNCIYMHIFASSWICMYCILLHTLSCIFLHIFPYWCRFYIAYFCIFLHTSWCIYLHISCIFLMAYLGILIDIHIHAYNNNNKQHIYRITYICIYSFKCIQTHILHLSDISHISLQEFSHTWTFPQLIQYSIFVQRRLREGCQS